MKQMKGRKDPWLVFSRPGVLIKSPQHCQLGDLDRLACPFSAVQRGVESSLEAQGLSSGIWGKLPASQRALVDSNVTRCCNNRLID